MLTRGKTLEQFRTELNEYFKVKHCFLVSSGKAALTLILVVLSDLHPGRDEVLIPAYCCFSVPSAITRAGLKVILCDIDPETLDYDYGQLEGQLSNPRLLCVLSTHLFGLPADVERVKKLTCNSPVAVIEDAAQAMGGEWMGKKLGTQGDVGIFSLGRGKALTTIEGGIILTHRMDIAKALEQKYLSLRSYSVPETLLLFVYALLLKVLIHPRLFWIPKAVPFIRLGETVYDPDFKILRMSAFQAGLASGWEKKIAEFRNIRKSISWDWAGLLKNEMPSAFKCRSGVLPDLIRFPWKIESSPVRESILFQSKRKGLGIAATYPDSVDRIPEIRECFPRGGFPVANDQAKKIVTLPVHPLLTPGDRNEIKKLILAAVGQDFGLD